MARKRAPKAAHHKGSYHVESRRIVAQAKANPATRCARCGRTLAQHPRTRDRGNPPRWSAGHVNKGEVGGRLVPMVLGCNVAEENDSRRGTKKGPRRALSPPAFRTSRRW